MGRPCITTKRVIGGARLRSGQGIVYLPSGDVARLVYTTPTSDVEIHINDVADGTPIHCYSLGQKLTLTLDKKHSTGAQGRKALQEALTNLPHDPELAAAHLALTTKNLSATGQDRSAVQSALRELQASDHPLATTSALSYYAATVETPLPQAPDYEREFVDYWQEHPYQESQITRYAIRREYVEKYSWAIPSSTAIAALLAAGPVVEVGAGRGYWARAVNEAGGDVLATDLHPPETSWTTVHPADANVTTQYPDRALFLCWPALGEDVGLDAALGHEGDLLIYVGEPRGGCCATDEFFDYLDETYYLLDHIALKSWPGIHDEMMVFAPR